MKSLVVGVADCLVSADPDAVLVTYALGSCIGVVVHDPIVRVGGLLHIMLPESSMDPSKAQQNPFMFADTGVPTLFRKLYEIGGEKRRMRVYLAGGAQVMDPNGVFNIGKRNQVAVKKLLWKAGVLVQSEALGGTEYRTIRLDVGSGTCWLREAGAEDRELSNGSSRGGLRGQ